MTKDKRVLWEANAATADWGGFTPEEMAQHALDMKHDTEVTCATQKEKDAVLKALKGKPGASRVEVLTLDEYEARVKKTVEHIARTAVSPATTDFSNPEPDAEYDPPPKATRKRGAPKPAAEPAKIVDEETGTERVQVSKRSKKMLNPAFAPKKRGG